MQKPIKQEKFEKVKQIEHGIYQAEMKQNQCKEIFEFKQKENHEKIDKLTLSHYGINEIPLQLYSGRDAQSKLMNLLILDLSANKLESLPENFTYNLISLKKLVLTMNKLEHLPCGVNLLKGLEILKIDNNKLTCVSPEIKELNSLIILDISKNKINTISGEVCSISSLRSLIAYSNIISIVSPLVNHLHSLKVIDLSRNNLADIPESFGSLQNLVKANLSRNLLMELPFNLELRSLEYLDLSYNSIIAFPDTVSKLQKLSTAKLQGNKFQEIGWKSWKSLTELDCSLNLASSISQFIGSMVLLCRLSCPMNKIEKIPPEIGLLKKLVHVNFQSNEIKCLPIEIGALESIKSLNLSMNKLKMLPSEFCLLSSLIWLNLSNNNIEKLPKYFGALSNITDLRISNNELSILPESIRCLKNLRQIDASSNHLKCFDFSPSNLEIIDLSSNHLSLISHELQNLSSLRVLNLMQNKLKFVPLELRDFIKKLDSVNLNRNPLHILHSEFISPTLNIQMHKKISSESNSDTINWFHDEGLSHHLSLEWNESRNEYLSGDKGFLDFIESVKKRLNTSFGNPRSIQLMVKATEAKIKRLFFESKQMGRLSFFRGVSNKMEREEQVKQAENRNTQHSINVLRVKKFQLEEQKKLKNLYFADFDNRLCQAEMKLRHAKELKKKQDFEIIHMLIEDTEARKIQKEAKASKTYCE